MRTPLVVLSVVVVLQAAALAYMWQNHERKLDVLAASARTRLADLVDRVDELEADVASIESSPPAPSIAAGPDPAVTAEMDGLQGDVEELTSSVETLASDVDALEEFVGPRFGGVPQLGPSVDVRVDGLEAQTAELQAQANQLEDDVAYVRDCIDEITRDWTSAFPPQCLDLTP